MYEKFKTHYNYKTAGVNSSEDLVENLTPELRALFSECGGCSFNYGMYRVHTAGSSLRWALNITNYFQDYRGKIIPFAFDWMGRHFAVHTVKTNSIFMFDPATGEDFELEESLTLFHNATLINESDSILAHDLFTNAIESLAVSEIQYNDCVGYKIPLFLGGVDNLENCEISDMEVYWEMSSQIYLQIKDLPPGTEIDTVKFMQGRK